MQRLAAQLCNSHLTLPVEPQTFRFRIWIVRIERKERIKSLCLCLYVVSVSSRFIPETTGYPFMLCCSFACIVASLADFCITLEAVWTCSRCIRAGDGSASYSAVINRNGLRQGFTLLPVHTDTHQ